MTAAVAVCVSQLSRLAVARVSGGLPAPIAATVAGFDDERGGDQQRADEMPLFAVLERRSPCGLRLAGLGSGV